MKLADLQIVRTTAIDIKNRKKWAVEIRTAWQKTVEGIFEVGRLLIEAKEEISHGLFEEMIREDLPFSPRAARMLMSIPKNDNLVNRKHASVLPPSWDTLYELSKQDDGTFSLMLDKGVIHPEMKRGDVKNFLKERVFAEKRKKEKLERRKKNTPTLEMGDAIKWLKKQEPADLILTDPPYLTDVDNIQKFAESWLPLALNRIKPTGRAYIFIGAYPEEIHAYSSIAMPEQILVWTYRNAIGPAPKNMYRLNWQAILYYQNPDCNPLDCPELNELFAVQDVNAPDGRHDGRYHAWEKPTDLADRFIRHSTKPGDVILDPFSGTGSFLVAACDLGRVAKGCEINKKMAAIARGRGCEILK